MTQLQRIQWQVYWVWWHEYSGCDVIAWCDIIKIGCDIICSSYDVIHVVSIGYMINYQDVNADKVDVLSDITSGCDVRYNSVDIMECSDVINHVWDVI